VICDEKDTDGRARVTTDEEHVDRTEINCVGSQVGWYKNFTGE